MWYRKGPWKNSRSCVYVHTQQQQAIYDGMKQKKEKWIDIEIL
jgi:hypothetical protein